MHWTRANAEEIFPSAITHLTWSIVGEPGERGYRQSLVDAGILPASESECPQDPDRRAWSIFFGRPAFNFDYLKYFAFAAFSSSDEDAKALRKAEGAVHRLRRLTRTMVSVTLLPRRLRRLRSETERWWRDRVSPEYLADPGRARAGLAEARASYERVSRLHVLNSVIPVASAYAAVGELSARAGAPDLASTLLGGFESLEEVRLAEAMWQVSHGRSTMAAFLGAFGFHGPAESEASSCSWREDPRPVDAVLQTLRVADPSHEPVLAERRRRTERRSAQRRLLRELRGGDRVRAVAVTLIGRRYVPLRQVGKASLVQTLDVARACARRLGADLREQGRLDDPEDVFFLTADEIIGAKGSADPLGDLVAWRRQRRESYFAFEIPRDFYGIPEPLDAAAGAAPVPGPAAVPGPAPGPGNAAVSLTGQGVSAGLVEGRARIVSDATQALEAGEILVSAFTDPGWTPLIAVAAGIVLDVGGSMSHGAIIARELGIPCVLGTGSATAVIGTGDLLRVDGARGVVEVVERAAPVTGVPAPRVPPAASGPARGT